MMKTKNVVSSGKKTKMKKEMYKMPNEERSLYFFLF
jgi:hypothetical protein